MHLKLRNIAINRKKFFISFSFKNLNLFKILFLVFTFGFIFGVILIGINQQESLVQLKSLMERFIKNRTQDSVLVTFMSSFIGFLSLILVLFLVGFFPLGQPIAFFILIFHGLGLGLCSAYLYSLKGIQGVIFCIFIVAPCEVLYVLLLLISANFSIRFSNNNFKNLFPEKYSQSNRFYLRKYVLRFITIFSFIFVVAFVDCLTTFIFHRFFNINLV